MKQTKDYAVVLTQFKKQLSYAITSKIEAINFIKVLQQIPGLQFRKSIYFIGENDKSDKKILSAINGYAKINENEIPLVCFDNTAFGGAKDGCLITTKGIYIHNMMEKSAFIQFSNINLIELKGFINKDVFINEYKIDVNLMEKEDKENFVLLLNLFTEKFINLDMNILRDNDSETENIYSSSLYSEDELKNYLENLKQQNRKYCFERSIYYLGESEKACKKFQCVIDTYVNLKKNETPLICFDNTLFGSGKEGCLITTHGIYLHNRMEKVIFFGFDILVVAELRGIINKEIYINDYKLDSTLMDDNDKFGFVEIINILFKKFGHCDFSDFEDDETIKKENKKEKHQNNEENSYKQNKDDYELTLEECYSILECTIDDDIKTIKAKYKKLIKQYHPDLFANNPQEFIDLANKKLIEINKAYQQIFNNINY